MTRLLSFARLSRSDRGLILQAILLTTATRFGLKILPLRQLRRVLGWIVAGSRAIRFGKDANAGRVVWAVTHTGRLGRHTCLGLALAAQTLLEISGTCAAVGVGARRRQDGGLDAHAWLERDGRIVLGNPIESFHHLARFERVRP